MWAMRVKGDWSYRGKNMLEPKMILDPSPWALVYLNIFLFHIKTKQIYTYIIHKYK